MKMKPACCTTNGCTRRWRDGAVYHAGDGGIRAQAGKQGLLDGFGISKMEETDGYLHVKLGFDGYNSVKTDKYPQGQPNQLVARGVESGASWIEKTPFVRPAVRRTQKSAVKAMQNIIDEETEKIME